jgi:hypothetical protein
MYFRSNTGDFFLISPIAGGSNSGVETSRSRPLGSGALICAAPASAIVGDVVGGIASISILVIALWYSLERRTGGGQAHYFKRPSPADILPSEGLYTWAIGCVGERTIRVYPSASRSG